MALKPAQFFVDQCQQFDEPDTERLPVTKDDFAKLDVLFNSVRHLDTTVEQLVKIYQSIFMYQCLESTGYFSHLQPSALQYFKDERKDPRVFFINLLFHFLLNTLSNNHSLTYSTPGRFEKGKYASAIFSKVVAIINHSCATNTGIVVQRDLQVTVATKRIEIGEEICHIYQGHFADTPLEERNKLMQDFFHFTCKCQACVENWPLYDELDDKFDNEEYESLTAELQTAFDAADYQKALQVMHKKLKLVCDNLQEPHKLYIKDRAAYLECLWQCYGNLLYQPKRKIQHL